MRAARLAAVSALQLLLAAGAAAQGSAPSAAAATPAPPGRVRGMVGDSLSGRPLAGATVELVHAGDAAAPGFRATADSLGRFRFDSVPAGDYVAGFYAPVLDSLRLEMPVRKLVVRAGHEERLALAVPSGVSLRRAYCGAASDSNASGVAIGTLRDAATGGLLAGGQIIAQTPTVVIRDGRIHTEVFQVTAITDAVGAFVLCGVPVGRELDVLGVSGSDSSGVFGVEVPATAVLVRDVFAGRPKGATVLAGRITNLEGAPIRGARVLVEGTTRQAVADDSGRFTLRDVPLGTHTLYTRAIGFYPDRRAVDVVATAATTLALRLPTMASVLDTMHVYGQRVYRDRLAFEERRQMGFGTVLQHARIEEMRPVHTTDILREVSGISLVPGQMGRLLEVRGPFLCLPDVIIDGHPIPLQNSVDEVDAWVQPGEVQAMEVYIGASAPVEYLQPGRPGCATILIWTNPAFAAPLPR